MSAVQAGRKPDASSPIVTGSDLRRGSRRWYPTVTLRSNAAAARHRCMSGLGCMRPAVPSGFSARCIARRHLVRLRALCERALRSPDDPRGIPCRWGLYLERGVLRSVLIVFLKYSAQVGRRGHGASIRARMGAYLGSAEDHRGVKTAARVPRPGGDASLGGRKGLFSRLASGNRRWIWERGPRRSCA